MRFRRPKPDVLIAGAGPVGLLTGLSLARLGVSVRIVDAAPGPVSQSRALALHPASLRLFDRLHLLGEVLPNAERVRTIGFYDGTRRRVLLPLQGMPGDFSFVAVIGQDRLQGVLIDALRREGVPIEWNHRVTRLEDSGSHTQVEIEKLGKCRPDTASRTERRVRARQTLEVPFLVGADGHASTVRRLLKIEFEQFGQAEHFAVFEFETDFEMEDELRITIGEAETDVLWPLSRGHHRWSFQLQDGEFPPGDDRDDASGVQELEGSISTLGNGTFERLVRERAPWFDGSLGEPRCRFAVRFQRRLAESFGRGRVWLVGDSAHTNYPVGAQSMNIGLREGNELAEAIAAVVQTGASLDRLEEFGRARREEWRFLLGRRGCVLPDTPADPWLSHHTQRVVSCLPASGRDLSHLARELGFQIVGEPVE